MFGNFAKLDSPRRLVQFWQNFQTSLVLLIPNCTRQRMITYTNNLTYILFKSIEQNTGLKVIIIYVVSLPFKFRTKTSTQHVPFCTPNMVILPI